MKKYLTALILSATFIAFPAFSQDAILYPPFSNETPPVNTQYASEEANVEFFESTYRASWDKLSDFEKYAIAFSSNLFQLNREYHLDFSGKTIYQANQGNPKNLLQKDWGITDYDSLVEMFNSLVTSGQSGSYKKLLALLNQYEGKSVLDIALAERLSILDITRLYYVRDTHDFLGSHDIEAWDLGRAITIMRWGIACDYISVEEATELCTPVVEKLKKDYVCWYDYFVHYIQGRGFYGLYEGKSEALMIAAISAASVTLNYIPLTELEFSGENADKEHSFTDDYTFCMSGYDDYAAWQKVLKIYSGNQTEDTLDKVCEFEEEFKEHSNIFFLWHLELLQKFGTNMNLVDFVDEKMDFVESLPKDSDLYVMSMYAYLCALNSAYLPVSALETFFKFPERLQYTTYFYYQYAYADYLMLTLCESQKEFEMYKTGAIEALTILRNSGYGIDNALGAWLDAIEK